MGSKKTKKISDNFSDDGHQFTKLLKNNRAICLPLLKRLVLVIRDIAEDTHKTAQFNLRLNNDLEIIGKWFSTYWPDKQWKEKDDSYKRSRISTSLTQMRDEGKHLTKLAPFLAWLWWRNEKEARSFYEEFNKKTKGLKDLKELPLERKCKFPPKTNNASELKVEVEAPQISSYLEGNSSEKLDSSSSSNQNDFKNQDPTGFNGAYNRFLIEYKGNEKNPRAFGGRGKEIKKLNKWLNEPDSPEKLLLTTPAGMGKSALLFNWAQQLLKDENNDWEVVFIPISIRFGSSQTNVFFPALAEKLATLYQKEFIPNSNPRRCQNFIEEWLGNPLPSDRKLLIIIDGMDEITGGGFQDGFLLKQATEIKIVVAARELAEIMEDGEWMERLHWDSIPNSVEPMTLGPLSRDGVQDVIKKMVTDEYQESWNEKDGVLDRLYELTDGDPLLVRFYVEDLWTEYNNRLSEFNTSDLKASEKGYTGYFKKWWKDQKKFWKLNKTSPFEGQGRACLAILACAKGRLKTQDIEDNLQYLDVTPFPPQDYISHFSRFVIGQDQEYGFILTHPKLNQFFQSTDIIGARLVKNAKEAFLKWGHDVLERLEKEEMNPEEASPYLLKFYSEHLRDQGEKVPLDDAMALVSNGWWKAWETFEGGYTGFARDVRFAWDRAAQLEKDNKKELVPNLGDQYRCALYLSLISTLGANMPTRLLALSIKTNQLTPQQVVNIVDLHEFEEDRANSLVSLAPYLPKRHLKKVLATALKINDEWSRVKALTELAPNLSDTLMPQALEGARQINSEEYRAEALTALVPHLGDELRKEAIAEALAIIRNINYDWKSPKVFSELAPHLSDTLMPQVLETARQVNSEECRAEALTALVPYLGDELRKEAVSEVLTVVQNIYEWKRPKVLTALAPHLPQTLMRQALEAAQNINDEGGRAEALTGLAPHLEVELRKKAALEALAVVQNIDIERILHSKLEKSEEERFEQTEVERFEEDRAEKYLIIMNIFNRLINILINLGAFTELISHIGEDLREIAILKALATAQRIINEEAQVKALAVLVPHLGEELREEVVSKALETVQDLNVKGKSEALTGLVPHLEDGLQVKEVSKALEAAQKINDERYSVQDLATLVPHLEAEFREQTISKALAVTESICERKRIKILTALAPHLNQTQMSHALVVAQNINNKEFLVQALAAMVPHLEGELREQTVLQALNVVKSIDEWERPKALRTLAPHLNQAQISHALAVAQHINNKEFLVQALAALVPHLEDGLQEREVSKALEAAQKINDERYSVQDLATLVPHLEAEFREQTISKALAVTESICERKRIKILTALAPHLNQTQISHALAVAQSFNNKEYRLQALAALMPHLEDELCEQTVFEAIVVVKSIGEWERPKALTSLAPHLNQTQISHALAVAQNINNKECRVQALAALVPHLDDAQRHIAIQEILNVFSKIIHSERREVNYFTEFAQFILPRYSVNQANKTAKAILDVTSWWL